MATPTFAPFRAGRKPGEFVGMRNMLRDLGMASDPSVTLLADFSEFQPEIDDAAYLAWSLAGIVRAAYGDAHDDRAWYGGQRRDFLHAGGIRFLGIYQYVVASQPVAPQADALIRLVGTLRRGEKLIADIEEGSFSQTARWREWSGLIQDHFGDMPWDYSGLNYAHDHGLQPVNWVAAYGQPEPTVPHDLWQFTDAFQVPGVGVADCSLYHGTIDQLAALAFQGTTPPENWTMKLIQELPTLGQGATGEDVRTVQGALIARHHTVTVDGIFGPATAQAVRMLQVSNLLVADGIVGQQTWPRLINR